MLQKEYFVYMMASRKGGAYYVGVTNNLEARIDEHKQGCGSKHVTMYKIHSLVYYEGFANIDEAIDWEKKLKRWRRAWKNALVEENNPQWRDLSEDF
jgi:putative endonuclease